MFSPWNLHLYGISQRDVLLPEGKQVVGNMCSSKFLAWFFQSIVEGDARIISIWHNLAKAPTRWSWLMNVEQFFWMCHAQNIPKHCQTLLMFWMFDRKPKFNEFREIQG